MAPTSIPHFKVKPYVLKDELFKERLKECIEEWLLVTEHGTTILECWEWMIKPGLCHLARDRQKEIEEERLGRLHVLFVKQNIYTSCPHRGNLSVLPLLHHSQLEIEEHYKVESDKIILQSCTEECSSSEKTRIFHHSLLKQNIKCSDILKVDNP